VGRRPPRDLELTSSILSPQSEKKIFSATEEIIASRFRGFYLARHRIGIAFAFCLTREKVSQGTKSRVVEGIPVIAAR
jgi:hypothetical protein